MAVNKLWSQRKKQRSCEEPGNTTESVCQPDSPTHSVAENVADFLNICVKNPWPIPSTFWHELKALLVENRYTGILTVREKIIELAARHNYTEAGLVSIGLLEKCQEPRSIAAIRRAAVKPANVILLEALATAINTRIAATDKAERIKFGWDRRRRPEKPVSAKQLRAKLHPDPRRQYGT